MDDQDTEQDHNARSSCIRKIIQNPNYSINSSVYNRKIPKRIVQFWDRFDSFPKDVQACTETWTRIEEHGFSRILFDRQRAGEFILNKLGIRYYHAFRKCYHPAMQSDYFRLCYIFVEGGCYVDTDDIYDGAGIDHLFKDGQLKIQPLCYDKSTNSMVSADLFIKKGAYDDSWIFYFNNNPLIACSGHPVIERALKEATFSLERKMESGLPEIQSTTGPGNLSKSIFEIVRENAEMEYTIHVLTEWENIAKNKWELDYRNDARNWRNSNGISYRGS